MDASAELRQMMTVSGYAERAVDYYIAKPYIGILADADQESEMTGSCGDTMKIYLKVAQDRITDARYEVLGCAAAVASAMAVVDLVKGKPLDQARAINDGDVFQALGELPAQKHHCIQLAVKTLHKGIDEYRNGGSPTA